MSKFGIPTKKLLCMPIVCIIFSFFGDGDRRWAVQINRNALLVQLPR